MRQKADQQRRSRWAALAALAVVLAGCGVESGATSAGYDGPPPTPKGWHHITVCTSAGPVEADLPSAVQWDGPRDLRHITAPATVTFGIAYSPDHLIRYDFYAIRDVDHYGDDDRKVARKVIGDFDGDPTLVDFRNIEQRGDHVVGTYEEPFDDRTWRARFVAHDGSIAVVSAGVADGSSPRTYAEAKHVLDVMWQSLAVAGVDGQPKAACDGPTDEPG